MKKNAFLIMLLFFTVILFFLIASSSVFAADWLIFKKPAYKGKVIDAETKEPIEGAVVVVVYRKENFGYPAGGYKTIVNVKETLTDKKGEFYFSSYTTLIQPLSMGTFTTFIIFKPGYGNFPEYRAYPPKGIPLDVLEEFFIGETGKEGELVEREKSGGDESIINRWKVTFGVVELPKLKTREERLKALQSADIPGPDIPSRKMQNLIRLFNEEAVSLGLKPISLP